VKTLVTGTDAGTDACVMGEVERIIGDGLARLGGPADAALAGAMVRYLALVQEWNRAYNLTRITDLPDMAVRHILDSASVRPFLAGASVLDAGSGAGLPGIPLALLEPARHFTLVDATGKKVRFLEHAAGALGLANVTTVQARLESWAPPAPFDTIVCRALASLAEFVQLCGRLVAPGGRLVAMKGRHPADELAALPPGWRATQVAPVTVPGLDAERHVVVLER